MCRLSKPQASKQASKQADKQGFTLIEVLIVVVIIGVLAALVIPRMLSSPEKAKMAEAYQMIGALMRAQQTRMDLTGMPSVAVFTCNPVLPSTCTLPSSLSMGDIIQKNFQYKCAINVPDYCLAYRDVPGLPYIARYFSGANVDKWECRDGYVTADGGVPGFSDKGCKPNW